jgi:tetratricopeptide (TPR) repeat protein
MRVRVLVAILALSAVARAAEPLTDDEAGKRHYLSAQAYFDQASYEDALREYQASYRLSKYPAILYQIGLCQQRLGLVSDAIASFEKYLELDPQSKRRVSVEATVQNLKERKKQQDAKAAPAPSPAPLVAGTPKGGTSRWLAPGLVLGLAAACLMTGAALTGAAWADHEALKTASDPGTTDYLARVDSAESLANGGFALLAIGGAAAVVDVVLWAVAAKRARARAMWAPAGGGAAWSFAF